MRMGPSNAFHSYMGYVGTNGAGREFVVFFFLNVCLFSEEAAFCVSGRIIYIIKTILANTTVFYCNNIIDRYKMIHNQYLELTV